MRPATSTSWPARTTTRTARAPARGSRRGIRTGRSSTRTTTSSSPKPDRNASPAPPGAGLPFLRTGGYQHQPVGAGLGRIRGQVDGAAVGHTVEIGRRLHVLDLEGVAVGRSPRPGLLGIEV